MKLVLTLAVAVAGFTAFAAPALAQPAGPLETAHEIFRRLNLPEGSNAIYEGEQRAQTAQDMVDLSEEETGEVFRCFVIYTAGSPQKCSVDH